MKINERVRLRDLRPISPEEFDTACRICEKIRKINEARASYVQKHGLDADIALPAGNWSEDNSIAAYNLYKLVVTPRYEVINRLRLHSVFTGYQLAEFSNSYGKEPILQPIPDNYDEEIERIAPAPDDWARRYITITRRLPRDIMVKVPKILGEIGWDVDGGVVNHDSYVYQKYLVWLWTAGVIDWLRKKLAAKRRVNILEIGAGYGGLAYQLKRIFPQANYYICDIPESLLFSALYLAVACPEYRHTIYDGTDKSALLDDDSGFKFIPNFMFDDLAADSARIDLAINTVSFFEMSEKQVRYYGQNLSHLLGSTGILFEYNATSPDPARPTVHTVDCKRHLSEYFRFRKTIWHSLGLVQGGADIWANKRISDILFPRLRRLGVLVTCARSLRVRPSLLIRFMIAGIVGEKRWGSLVAFIQSRPRLKSFVHRVFG